MIERIQKWIANSKPIEQQRITSENIPQHVAIIMDGNGRWARGRGLPRIVGHQNGMKNVKKVTIAANEIGVKVLTLFAFSTENWKRPKTEVDFLMKLPEKFFPLEMDELIEKNVQVRMTGSKEDLPPSTLKVVEDAIETTKMNDGLILNFAFNYGSRWEMVDAIRKIAKDVHSGELLPEQITEKLYTSYLQTGSLPDPDLLIRTSGELRISNFMLWQLAYTELWFTDLKWPEFTEHHFYEAVAAYQERVRRYGGV